MVGGPAGEPVLLAFDKGRLFAVMVLTMICLTFVVFYLVNLALHLGLYSDDDNLALSPWDFVALVGRALLGDAAADDDPVWPLLAEGSVPARI